MILWFVNINLHCCTLSLWTSGLIVAAGDCKTLARFPRGNHQSLTSPGMTLPCAMWGRGALVCRAVGWVMVVLDW